MSTEVQKERGYKEVRGFWAVEAGARNPGNTDPVDTHPEIVRHYARCILLGRRCMGFLCVFKGFFSLKSSKTTACRKDILGCIREGPREALQTQKRARLYEHWKRWRLPGGGGISGELQESTHVSSSQGNEISWPLPHLLSCTCNLFFPQKPE